ncbi:hypothetical protein LEN26_010209 [Aphanomyces euteiches]|nr:hypothetical protein AeMF1_017622 [Aphanomyces euteiches]KAH9122553.1 hypothetical protein LEN26_010209 [Aphanomyces euteiches]KAH9196510.1 hypothetical protein AeNC1_001534 [Aphanomyces euteiches]
MMASTMSTSSLREALQALGISSNTPGVRGDERRAILLARYMDATGGGGGGVKPGTSTAQQMSMTDLRRELGLRGINTNTPGLRGDDRRAALLSRWQTHCQQPVVAAPDHEDHGESNNRMEEAQDSMADPMAQPSTSPLKRSQQLKAEAKRLQVDIDAIQQAKTHATTDDKERKRSKLSAELENEKIAALHDLQERIKKQSLVGFNEILQVSKEDERRTSPTKPTNKHMNPLLQTQTLTDLRRQMLPTAAAMTSRSDSLETVNRDRIHSFPITQPTALSRADSLGRKAFFLHRIKGDFAAAEAAYNEAIDADPTHSVNLGHFALFLDRVAKRYDDAEEFYLRAIDASSEIPMHLSLYANFLNRVRHDSVRAEEYYLRCLRDFPRDADTLGNYANFLRYTKHDLAAASSYFAKAMAVDPSHANNLSQFASLLSEIGQLDRADACYEKAIQLDGDNPTICGNYANLLVKQAKLDAAKSLYLKAMQLDPDSHIAQQNYAIFLRDHPSMRTGETRRIAMHPKDRWAMSVKQTTQLVRATAAFQQQNPPVH